MEPKAMVLMPLYIWPVEEKNLWGPLFEAIAAHPKVTFLVVVNPNSGPGALPLPGHDYEREVPKLNANSNVVTVGYVRVDYCKRPLHDVCEEIDRYAGWASEYDSSKLGVKGIYLDETPNHHSAGRALYLEALQKHIKNNEGILSPRLVIHNPGTPPDAALADPGPDVIVTCEEPCARYRGEDVQKRLRDYHYDRERSGYQISGVPKDEIKAMVQELRHRGAYLFVTDLVDDFYESFGDSWAAFVSAVDSEESGQHQEKSQEQEQDQEETAVESTIH